MLTTKYKIEAEISSGCFGKVYSGYHKKTREWVAIKEEIKTNVSTLKHEAKIYQYLSGVKQVPSIKWFGATETHLYLVLPLLHQSLETYKHHVTKLPEMMLRTMTTTIVEILQAIHEKQIVHCDIKPSNFMIDSKGVLFLIDFGFARVFSPHERLMHSSIGTMNYMSRRVHMKQEPKYVDDLESAFYVILYLHLSDIPWKHESQENIVHKKQRTLEKLTTPSYLRNLAARILTCAPEDTINYASILCTQGSETT